jgi:zinc transporter ZupT
VSNALPSTLLALFAAGSLVFGSALPTMPMLRARLFARNLSLLIGFSAGLMLATALHELLPEALHNNEKYAMWGAGAGFLVLYAAERFTHFHACRHRECDLAEEAAEAMAESTAGHAVLQHLPVHPSGPAHNHDHAGSHGHSHGHGHHLPHGHADTMALVGMGIHNFADGLATAAAFAVSHVVGLVVVLAIVLHQAAAGLSLGAIMLRVGRSHRRILLSTTVIASFIVWGALFYQMLPVGPQVQGVILGIAGGSFLYVAACDLLPEAHADDEGWKVTTATLLGYGFTLLVQLTLQPHTH